jgi:hypothetical protein
VTQWGPRRLFLSSRTPSGQNLAALASNLFVLGFNAVQLRLGVLVSVASIHANVIRAIAKIPLVPSILVLAYAEMSAVYRNAYCLVPWSI